MCGLAGSVSIIDKKRSEAKVDLSRLKELVSLASSRGFDDCLKSSISIGDHYLGGKETIDQLLFQIGQLKKDEQLFLINLNDALLNSLGSLSEQINQLLEMEGTSLTKIMGHLSADEVEAVSGSIEGLKDAAWRLDKEIIENIEKIKNFASNRQLSFPAFKVLKEINSVFNSIDRLEVRGRDSAGISLMFFFDETEFGKLRKTLEDSGLFNELQERSKDEVLVSGGIRLRKSETGQYSGLTAVALVYKIAAEIGRLGDNVRSLRKQIAQDQIFHALIQFDHRYHTVSSHTRWASVGAINEANCHPVDNRTEGAKENAIIQVCLNGDIDNYLELKEKLESSGPRIPAEITTDTKIIPLLIESLILEGKPMAEAFRCAVNQFHGSHAISMHTDLEPGKLFLAQRGSGQAIFVGLAENNYVLASEVYGLIEETPFYLKLDGEKWFEGKNGKIQGQIFVLDQNSNGGLDGIQAMYYDGTPVFFTEENIKCTAITSRDIDRQDFPHYFLKEISESPSSVEKTLLNRWKIIDAPNPDLKRAPQTRAKYVITIDDKICPEKMKRALVENSIRRIFFVGQGTAGVAALACANITTHYMNDSSLLIKSLKASELSGFIFSDTDNEYIMQDSLVIAITQSGTTADTNRTVDMARDRGAYILAIVNRRDSDITFKVDGVMYTSSGRDIEMSVASTKAFYSQIVAGALLGLYLAHLKGLRNEAFVEEEIKQLLTIPDHMRKILSMGEQIAASANRLAVSRTHWAAVGSGPNKASADEIRIKLSELCYKTISSDYVEDKKHIDLSSEPLIIVCAAGTRSSVLGDIIKDTAIFKAHKALPVVIADEGEYRFAPYAEDVFYVPKVNEHFAPILNTLVGHIWGYFAALAINEGSLFLYNFREKIHDAVEQFSQRGLDIYEILLDRPFKEEVALFYYDFRKMIAEKRFPSMVDIEISSNLILLLKYLSGRLPVSDFELDFGKKGTPMNMLGLLFEVLSQAINALARPVDAIKHQAKTVTVGTSRISKKIEGILFDTLEKQAIKVGQLTPINIIILKNMQGIISEVLGLTFYRISGLDLLGEPTDETQIEVLRKEGTSKGITSRAEIDNRLIGTKRIIVREGNVYIGKGRKDNRSLLIIPVLSVNPKMSSQIENLLLLNIKLNKEVSLSEKIKALGGKYEHIKNIVQENNIIWDERYLELIEMEELFGRSAEKIAEQIMPRTG